MKKAIFPDFHVSLFLVTVTALNGCAVRGYDSQSEPMPAVESDVSVSGQVIVGNGHSRIAVIISDDDRRHIHDYYYRQRDREDYDDDQKKKSRKNKDLPPGLVKREELPPGLQQQIRRHGQLPPGIEGRRLPEELEHTLSRLPAGYVRLQVGRDIVLMEQRRRIMVDVIKNIIP